MQSLNVCCCWTFLVSHTRAEPGGKVLCSGLQNFSEKVLDSASCEKKFCLMVEGSVPRGQLKSWYVHRKVSPVLQDSVLTAQVCYNSGCVQVLPFSPEEVCTIFLILFPQKQLPKLFLCTKAPENFCTCNVSVLSLSFKPCRGTRLMAAQRMLN